MEVEIAELLETIIKMQKVQCVFLGGIMAFIWLAGVIWRK